MNNCIPGITNWIFDLISAHFFPKMKCRCERFFKAGTKEKEFTSRTLSTDSSDRDVSRTPRFLQGLFYFYGSTQPSRSSYCICIMSYWASYLQLRAQLATQLSPTLSCVLQTPEPSSGKTLWSNLHQTDGNPRPPAGTQHAGARSKAKLRFTGHNWSRGVHACGKNDFCVASWMHIFVFFNFFISIWICMGQRQCNMYRN